MNWLLRRIGTSALLIWLVASVVFLAIHLAPVNRVEPLLPRPGVAPDPAAVVALHEQLGLDRPVLAQYVVSVGQLLRGNLGRSLQDGRPIADEIWLRLPRTLELIAVATIFAALVGIPGGLLVAMRRETAIDRIAAALSVLAMTIPAFVVGTLLVLLFSQGLRPVPADNYVPLADDPLRHLALLAMPAFAIGIGLAAALFRMTRASVLELSQRNFVRTARAKGITHMRIMLHHVLRNALLPVVAGLAPHLGTFLGGTVLVEYLFDYPGLSGLLVDAVNAHDYPMVGSIVVVLSVLLVALNLAVDLLHALLDPRVRTA